MSTQERTRHLSQVQRPPALRGPVGAGLDLATPAARLTAFVTDLGLAVVAAVLATILSGALSSPDGRAGALGVLLGLSVYVGYLAAQLYMFSRATSLGKRALGLRVVRQDRERVSLGVMLVRETIGKLLSAIVLWLGFLWVVVDDSHQGWHDKLVDSYVVRM